jgi:hypothetical protein
VASSSTPSAGKAPTIFGFNTYTSPLTISQQKQIGAPVQRIFVPWSSVEASSGQWNWQAYDQQYAAIVAAGLRPLVVVYAAPCWARPSTACSSSYTGPPDPAWDGVWYDFVSRVAARYPAAIGIEIWNEPNLDTMFWPHADPARYSVLLHEAYIAIKNIRPTMPVVSGGLILTPAIAGISCGPGGCLSGAFLQGMYAAGAAQWMDALGVHIYPDDLNASFVPTVWDPTAMTRWLSDVSAVRVAAGVSSQPIWITEMGVSTSTQPGWPVAATPAQQASYLLAMARSAEADPNVAVAIIHGLEDQNAGATDAVETGFGVFTATGTPKPAACALSAELHGSLSC